MSKVLNLKGTNQLDKQKPLTIVIGFWFGYGLSYFGWLVD